MRDLYLYLSSPESFFEFTCKISVATFKVVQLSTCLPRSLHRRLLWWEAWKKLLSLKAKGNGNIEKPFGSSREDKAQQNTEIYLFPEKPSFRQNKAYQFTHASILVLGTAI